MKDKYTIVVRHLKTGETQEVKVAASNLELHVVVTALEAPGKIIRFTAEDVSLSLARHTSRRLDKIKHDMHTRALATRKSKPQMFGVVHDTTHHIQLTEEEFKQLVDERIELSYENFTKDLEQARLQHEAAQERLSKLVVKRNAWKENKDRVKYLGYVTQKEKKA